MSLVRLVFSTMLISRFQGVDSLPAHHHSQFKHFHTVLFQSIRPSCVTGQVDMAEIRHLSQVTEAVTGVEKPLVKKAKKNLFGALRAAFDYPS